MTQVLLARDADSPGYTHFVVADPIVGLVQADTTDDQADDGLQPLTGYSIELDGQREFDVPGTISSVTFPDGDSWTPPKKR
jgi:hypothetical protein